MHSIDWASRRLPTWLTIGDGPPGHTTILGTVLVAGWAMSEVVRLYPATLPVWMPYEFSWGVYLGCALSLAWYIRGIAVSPDADRPTPWRKVAFFAGLGLIYAALHTHYDYAAQHMFFIHRIQHLVLHHTGPFLLALSNPGRVIARGMPEAAGDVFGLPCIERTMSFLQQPVVAVVLFVGLIYLWPAPTVHFYAMLDPRLYTVMNWSVTIDGILFWVLILDPRPSPSARLSYGARLICCLVVMFPQILLGALVTFCERDLFDVYAICGRIIPMTALEDQEFGGLILWIPGSMMSVFGVLLVLNAMRLDDEAREAVAIGGKPARG